MMTFMRDSPCAGLYSRSYLENQMAVALGGRIAEELIFGEDDITTGASSDFQQVSRIARLMVTQLGFSKTLGQVRFVAFPFCFETPSLLLAIITHIDDA